MLLISFGTLLSTAFAIALIAIHAPSLRQKLFQGAIPQVSMRITPAHGRIDNGKRHRFVIRAFIARKLYLGIADHALSFSQSSIACATAAISRSPLRFAALLKRETSDADSSVVNGLLSLIGIKHKLFCGTSQVFSCFRLNYRIS